MTAPRIPGVLESVVYATDLEAAERFYHGILGLEVHARQEGRHVFLRCGAGMFLVFNPDATEHERVIVNGTPIPRHGTRGPGHVAFRIPQAEVERWRRYLARARVAIEAEVRWASGGQSLYVRDPAGNSVELATAATWGLGE